MSQSLYEVTAFSLHYDGPVRNLCLMSDDGMLRYDEKQVVYSSTAKFGFEESKTNKEEGQLLVHFRCLHNNKYLVRKKGTNWITATSKVRVEDLCSDDCTLFKVDIIESSCSSATVMTWTHLASKKIVGFTAPDHEDPTHSYYLTLTDPCNCHHVKCTPIDVECIIPLPKTVVLCAPKADNKYHYLEDNLTFLSLIGNDRNRKEAWFDIIPRANGDVRIKCVKTGKFWKRSQVLGFIDEILANDDNQTADDPNTYFKVVRLSDDTIALINIGDSHCSTTTPLFCRRWPDEGHLFANVDTAVKETEFKVEEPIVSRNIIEVEYRLDDARVYDVQPRSWLSEVAHNDAKEGNLETTLSISYTEAMSCTFTNTASVYTNFTAQASFKTCIPLVAEASAEAKFTTGSYVTASFGKTIDKSQTVQFSVTVIIPPGQQRRARLMATEAKCDVPFSYMLKDVSADNVVTRTKLTDGVYHGMNGFEFYVQVFDPTICDQLQSDHPHTTTQMLPDTREKVYPTED